MQPRSNLLARGPVRFDLCARVRSLRALTLCVGLAATGCSFHAHSEFHTGKGGDNSAGSEHAATSAHPEPAAHEHNEGRHSSAGRDNVVRVTTGSSKPAVEQGGGAEEPARTAVHPTGDVPPRSSGGTEGAAAGSASGGSSSGSAEGSGAAESANNKPPESAAPAAAPADEAPNSTGKGTNKSPSEPHVTTPTHTKPRKVHRTSASSTNKEGGHE